jgi:hypothetical protein
MVHSGLWDRKTEPCFEGTMDEVLMKGEMDTVSLQGHLSS